MNVNGIPATPEHLKELHERVKDGAVYDLGGTMGLSDVSIVRVRPGGLPFGPYDQPIINPSLVVQFVRPRAKPLSASRHSAVTLQPGELGSDDLRLHNVLHLRTQRDFIELFIQPKIAFAPDEHPPRNLRLYFTGLKTHSDIPPSSSPL
jgi:hypothetical protein